MSETPTESLAAIEALLSEQRTFPPPDEFRADAVAGDESVYRRAAEDPDAFWLGLAKEFVDLGARADEGPRVGSAALHLVRGRTSSTSPRTASTATSRPGNGDRVAYHWVGEPEGETRDVTYARAPLPGLPARERPPRHSASRRATGSGSTWGWSRSSRSRCSPARGSARRTSSSSAASRPTRWPSGCAPPDAKVLITQDEGWRKGGKVPLKANADEAVAETPVDRERRRPPPNRRRSVAWNDGRDVWWHDARRRRDGRVPSREPMDAEDTLFLLHTSGTTAKPKGVAAHERRLPDPRRRHAQVDLRHPRRHGLVVRGRHRLGHRPQLHRLRPARERRHERPLRGRPGLSGLGSPLGDRRALRRQLVLHRADAHPLVREGGRRVSRPARPLLAPAARDGRRADQSRRRGSGTGR